MALVRPKKKRDAQEVSHSSQASQDKELWDTGISMSGNISGESPKARNLKTAYEF